MEDIEPPVSVKAIGGLNLPTVRNSARRGVFGGGGGVVWPSSRSVGAENAIPTVMISKPAFVFCGRR